MNRQEAAPETARSPFGVFLMQQHEDPDLLLERAEVVVRGELDLATSPRVRRVLSDVLRSGTVDIIIDLAAVTFIDASGIGVLAEIADSAHSVGGSVVLRRPSPRVLRVLDLVKLHDILPLESPAETPS